MLKATPEVLKAAKLFVAPTPNDYGLDRPRLYRERGKNIVWASDGHIMFVANDVKGTGFRPYPKKRDKDNYLPDWARIMAAIPANRKRSNESVWVDPKLLSRVTRAASLLKVASVPIKMGGSSDPFVFALGDNACAVLMPMRREEVPTVPTWLAEHCAPETEKPAPKAKRKVLKKSR